MSRSGIRARISAIRRDHSRAQVHAIDPDGLEFKLEVPLAAVAGVTAGDLVLSWSIEPTALAGSIPSTSSPTDDFQSLMARLNPTPAPAATSNPTPAPAATTNPSERLARLLGLTITES